MISVLQLGTLDYSTGLRLQQKLVELRKENRIGDVLLLLEHSPVITLGRNADKKNILASAELLSQRGVEVFESDRGGDVTFHGPGQLVGYPIFDLRSIPTPEGRRKTLGPVEFVRRLEEVLIRTCADFRIPTQRLSGLTGVWTDPPSLSFPQTLSSRAVPYALSSRAEENDSLANRSVESRDLVSSSHESGEESSTNREGHDFSRADMPTRKKAALAAEAQPAKIAAIGVHISRAVTSHGFALNVNSDLSFFDLIIPCGLVAKPVTSMQKELAREVPLLDVAHSIARHFGTVFSSQILWLDTLDSLLKEEKLGVPMQPPAEMRQMHGDDDLFLA